VSRGIRLRLARDKFRKCRFVLVLSARPFLVQMEFGQFKSAIKYHKTDKAAELRSAVKLKFTFKLPNFLPRPPLAALAVEACGFREIQIARREMRPTRPIDRARSRPPRPPLSALLISHSSTTSARPYPPPPPPTTLRPSPTASLLASLLSRGCERGRSGGAGEGGRGAGRLKAERAGRRYLKHMQRVQLRSGSHRGREERGKKSRTMAARVRLPGIRLTTIYATSTTTTTTTTTTTILLPVSHSHPRVPVPPIFLSLDPVRHSREAHSFDLRASPAMAHSRNSARPLSLIVNVSN